MRVLIACEFSGIVREEFRRQGHDAWSYDLIDSEIPGQHVIGDVRAALLLGWDLMVAFPPCRYLASSGARWWRGRRREQAEALEFVRTLMEAPIDRIAIENPPGAIGSSIRPADQYIQPWQFGHGETKKTGLWLKGLPLLEPTAVVEGREPRVHRESPGPDRWKRRSRTYQGVANAMATQWGSL